MGDRSVPQCATHACGYGSDFREGLHMEPQGLTGRRGAYKIYYLLAKNIIEKPALRSASGLLAVSVSSQLEYTKNYHLPSDKVVVARHSINSKLA